MLDHSSMVLAMLALVAFILAIVVIVDNSKDNNGPENQTGEIRSDVAANTATKNNFRTAFKSTLTKQKSNVSKLPAALYAGLNYGNPIVERIPASQQMITALDGMYDNTKQIPTMGENAIFFTDQVPDAQTMAKFNDATMASVNPDVKKQVTVIVQTAPENLQGKVAVYAFLDKGIQWDEDLVDYCMDPSNCVRSDIYY